MPFEMTRQLTAQREARFAALERFRDSLPEYDEDEVLADTAEAVKAVRRERADDHSRTCKTPPKTSS